MTQSTTPTDSAKLFVIVDDVEAIRTFLQSLLEYNGHKCETFGDASSTMQYLATNKPDTILVDLNLGSDELDGLGLIQSIRKVHATVPVIVLTGMGMEDGIVPRAIQAGASGYLTKGLSAETVYHEIIKYTR